MSLFALEEIEHHIFMSQLKGKLLRRGIRGGIRFHFYIQNLIGIKHIRITVNIEILLCPGQGHINLVPVLVIFKRNLIQQQIDTVEFPALGLVDGGDKNGFLVIGVKILIPGPPDKLLQVAAVLSIAIDPLKIGNEVQAVFQAGTVVVGRLKTVFRLIPNCVANYGSGT